MVHRADHSKNFTAINTSTLRDPDISMKARGLLCFCLSLPDDWEYSVEGLASIAQEGPDAILTMVRELEKAGYIHREQQRKPNGKLGKMKWDIYEVPQSRMEEDTQNNDDSCIEETAEAEEVATCEEVLPEPEVAIAAITAEQEAPATEEAAGQEPVTAVPAPENTRPDRTIPAGQAPESTAQLNIDKLNIDPTKYRQREGTCARNAYGPFKNVFLSDDEISRLKAEFPDRYLDKINYFSSYMASTGRRYENHYATLCKWLREDAQKAARAAPKAAGVTAGSVEIKGVPYGNGAPGKHELDAMRRLAKKHGKELRQ